MIVLLVLQASLNNLINVVIKKAFNEIIYDFKIKKVLSTLISKFDFIVEKERFRH